MFTTNIKIRFNHIDAAGIVFYPRYYEMFNQVVEEWIEATFQYDFFRLDQELRAGLPAVRIEASFPKPTRLGETLTFSLAIKKLGNSSLVVALEGSANGETRVAAELTLVYIVKSDDRRFSASAIPHKLRRLLADYLASGTQHD